MMIVGKHIIRVELGDVIVGSHLIHGSVGSFWCTCFVFIVFIGFSIAPDLRDAVSVKIGGGENKPKTMEDAFDYVLKSHDYYAEDVEGYKKLSFDRLKYNKTYFYPETFYLDYEFRRDFPEDCIIDTWMNPEFKIIDFKILKE
jgi:hypothetical protein